MGKAATPRPRRRERKNITSGVAHVNASFNNTVITITDAQGNTVAWASGGSRCRRAQGPGAWGEDPRGRGQGAWLGPRVRAAGAAGRRLQHHLDQGRDADSA